MPAAVPRTPRSRSRLSIRGSLPRSDSKRRREAACGLLSPRRLSSAARRPPPCRSPRRRRRPRCPPSRGTRRPRTRIKPTIAPQNPFMAANPNNNIHNDTWMTDAYQRRGPLGRSLVANSDGSRRRSADRSTFDRKGRILSVCPSAVAPPQARIIDPDTLATIASYDLPTPPTRPAPRPTRTSPAAATSSSTTATGSGSRPRPTTSSSSPSRPTARAWSWSRDFDLTGVLDESSERITLGAARLPRPDLVRLEEERQGRHARPQDRAHPGEDAATRRSRTPSRSAATASTSSPTSGCTGSRRAPNGKPRIVWQAGYKNSGVVKPSQVDAGSGTTPTIMSGGYVAITDNAEPMNVVVYRTAGTCAAASAARSARCPVFAQEDRRDRELADRPRAGRSIVENNYGYQDPSGRTAAR